MADTEHEPQTFQLALSKLRTTGLPTVMPGDEVVLVVRCGVIGPAGDGTLGLLPLAIESLVLDEHAGADAGDT